MSPLIKEALGSHNRNDAANDKCKANNSGEEDQGTAPGSTNPPWNYGTIEVQGFKQRLRHHHEQEWEVGPEGVPGKTSHIQVPKRGQSLQGPPVEPKIQSKIKGPRKPQRVAHRRDLARQRVSDSVRHQWQRNFDGIREKPGEERDPPGAGELKDKRVTRREPPGSPKGTTTSQPAGTSKSLQEQKHTTSSRHAHPSQPKETPEAKGQDCTGL